MKVLTLTINDQTYMTGKISAYMTKEAMKLQKEALEMAKKGLEVAEVDLKTDAALGVDLAEEVLNASLELLDRKAWLICEVFENKFTSDDLLKGVSNEDIDATINLIIGAVSKVIEKN
jgi:hypothetical protein